MSNFAPSKGYSSIEEEFEDRMAKVFRSGADYACVPYSKHYCFQLEGAAHCKDKGLVSEQYIEREQDAEFRYRLTDKGRKYWKL